MTEYLKNKPTDIEQSIERIEVLLSTALEELSYAKEAVPEDTVEILRAQNRELYEENDKLRQEIQFLRMKEKQAIDTQMYQSVWMQNDELQLKIRDLKAELATERAYHDSALALAKAIIRDVESKI